MQKSVLVEITSSLTRKEIRDLHKWLQSPAHNQRSDVIQLFDYLTKNPSNDEAFLEKERAWNAIAPKEPYDDARMRQVMYFLLKSIEQFLIFNDVTADPVQGQIALTKIYLQRKLDKSYRQASRLAREYMAKQPLRNSRYLLQKTLLELEENNYWDTSQNVAYNLQETSDALEKWFLAEKLRISYAMWAHQKVYQTANYDTGMLESNLQYLNTRDLLNEPAIGIFYYAYLTILEPTEEKHFDKLVDLIEDASKLFNHTEARTLYVAAINYCILKGNQGRLDFTRRLFVLYRTGLEDGILLDNNLVSKYTFVNAVGAALRTGEYGWAEQFIEQFQHHLEEKEQQSIVNFNLSRVYFEKGDYNQAQRLLTRFEYDDMLFNIIAKTMLLKIYYEQSELDAFESLLESMRIYLQRKEALDATRKTAYKNMISVMKKLLNLNPYSNAQKEKFKTLIATTNPLPEREWLLKQVGER
ncbi:MAG: hypothetical protein IT260_04665 [Saprospiraceae bacterium]|nr:hypothetical protein [Saprospiraceae bacterium]